MIYIFIVNQFRDVDVNTIYTYTYQLNSKLVDSSKYDAPLFLGRRVLNKKQASMRQRLPTAIGAFNGSVIVICSQVGRPAPTGPWLALWDPTCTQLSRLLNQRERDRCTVLCSLREPHAHADATETASPRAALWMASAELHVRLGRHQKAKAAIASATPIHAAPCMRRPFSPACGCRGIAVRSHTAGAPRKFPDRGPRRRASSQERGAEAHEEYRVADGHERCGLPRKLRLRSKHHTLN